MQSTRRTTVTNKCTTKKGTKKKDIVRTTAPKGTSTSSKGKTKKVNVSKDTSNSKKTKTEKKTKVVKKQKGGGLFTFKTYGSMPSVVSKASIIQKYSFRSDDKLMFNNALERLSNLIVFIRKKQEIEDVNGIRPDKYTLHLQQTSSLRCSDVLGTFDDDLYDDLPLCHYLAACGIPLWNIMINNTYYEPVQSEEQLQIYMFEYALNTFGQNAFFENFSDGEKLNWFGNTIYPRKKISGNNINAYPKECFLSPIHIQQNNKFAAYAASSGDFEYARALKGRQIQQEVGNQIIKEYNQARQYNPVHLRNFEIFWKNIPSTKLIIDQQSKYLRWWGFQRNTPRPTLSPQNQNYHPTTQNRNGGIRDQFTRPTK